ncbi:hypothetical protein BT96DRAFT_1009106 [Gymnopus androsaceus JB14]|uniref:Uncharacterized protein n=1 Tax=Gymnopus androsaceus JB14 TaxID=1447944 RepID=A0A6A4GDB7_9AGAR|nr:hypothetical protein BT96DRAFT_1009106 [Gymnopus androsaceus JB14]
MSSTATVRNPSTATAKTPALFPPVRKSPRPSENNSEAESQVTGEKSPKIHEGHETPNTEGRIISPEQTNSPNGSVSGGTILDRTKALEMMNNEAANVSSVGNRRSGKNSGVGIFQSTPIRSPRGPSLFPPDAPKSSKQVTLGKKGSDRKSDAGSNVPAEGKSKLGHSLLSTNDDNIIDFDSIDQEGTNAPISRFVAGLPKTPAENESQSPVQHQTDNREFKGKGKSAKKVSTNHSSSDSSELRPEDSASQIGSRPSANENVALPGNKPSAKASNISNSSAMNARVLREKLRGRVILQMLHDIDVLSNQKTIVPHQGITFKEEWGFDPKMPSVKINADQIPDEDVIPYRDQYPEVKDEPPAASQDAQEPSDPFSYPDNGERDRKGGKRRSGNKGDPPSEPSDSSSDSDESSGNDSNESEDQSRSENENYSRSNGNSGRNKSTALNNRYHSEAPSDSMAENYTYDPTPRTNEEILCVAFERYQKLIEFQLYGPPMRINSAAHKTIVQNTPKPGKYGGSTNYAIFDDWIIGFIQWLNIVDNCGPATCWSVSRQAYVLTSADIVRVNTLGSFLEGEALRWFRSTVQRVPSGFQVETTDPLAHRWSFMQVVNGLYQRFIHKASISEMSDKFYQIKYIPSKGVKSMFEELERWATCMPTPPDIYTFKKCIMLLVPSDICKDMTKIKGVSAEMSSVNDIMKAAIACEKSERANKYYDNARVAAEQNQSAMRNAHRDYNSPTSSKDCNRSSVKPNESRAPRRLQVVEDRRYSIPDHKNRVSYNERKDNKERDRASRPTFPPGSCFDCGPSNTGPHPPKMYRIAEEVQKDGERLFRLEVTNSEGNVELLDEEIYARYASSDQEDADHIEPASEDELDPWGGSQYESDAADEEYLPDSQSGEKTEPTEHLGHIRDWDSFADHWKDKLESEFDSLVDSSDEPLGQMVAIRRH